jgi:hypothetical protein
LNCFNYFILFCSISDKYNNVAVDVNFDEGVLTLPKRFSTMFTQLGVQLPIKNIIITVKYLGLVRCANDKETPDFELMAITDDDEFENETHYSSVPLPQRRRQQQQQQQRVEEKTPLKTSNKPTGLGAIGATLASATQASASSEANAIIAAAAAMSRKRKAEAIKRKLDFESVKKNKNDNKKASPSNSSLKDILMNGLPSPPTSPTLTKEEEEAVDLTIGDNDDDEGDYTMANYSQ